ncbi:hypothetical protein [Nannocystis punicea]|uniref:Myxococcus cysteine-rich repeat-containing protein n=1 Tax=Nannocystis punicea TaxID=2995304 RepID=A0ABY7H8Q4_9BACT|nr:hypothetical protein [Nannocystis poenicansa]WAS95485.1 hypothetical protein O0S08_04930 [Nannocystis poenicansa]
MHRPHSLIPSALGLLSLVSACGLPPGADTETASDGSTATTTDTTSGGPTETTAVDPTTTSTTDTGVTTLDPPTGTTTTTTTTGTSTTMPDCLAECGDGVVECDEACDAGPDNNDIEPGACRTDCTAAGCGDGVVDLLLAEQCDDGNPDDGDGCSATCQVEVGAACGDGVLDLDQGEECDDANADPEDGCGANCQLEPPGDGCGDGLVNAVLDVCDDGNLANGDACNPTCNLANTTSLFVGTQGNLGLKDGIGSDARISGTGGLAVDLTHLYLADAQNNCIRRIDIESAAVETIAGSNTGVSGYADAADGLDARFASVDAIATDGKTLWVSDGMNKLLRAVSLTPPFAVTTVAGDGTTGVADGIGTAATFDDNRGLTYYAGHVYMVDASAAVLRRFDPVTQEVVTLAGLAYENGSADGVGEEARFTSPRDLTSDNSGMLYLADTNGFAIRSFNTVTGHVGTFAGTGSAGYVDGVGTGAAIHRPRGLASDGASLYFGEFGQHTVRQGIFATREVSTNAGQHCDGVTPCPGDYIEGTGVEARFNAPFALAYHYPSKSLFVLDSANRVIRRVE